jgi:hypothetical protein
MEYGILVSRASDIFSDALLPLQGLGNSNAILTWIAIDVLMFISYFLIRTWLGWYR